MSRQSVLREELNRYSLPQFMRRYNGLPREVGGGKIHDIFLHGFVGF